MLYASSRALCGTTARERVHEQSRKKALKSARAEGVQPLTSAQIRNGLNSLSMGVQESFARIKSLAETIDDTIEDLNGRLVALEGRVRALEEKAS